MIYIFTLITEIKGETSLTQTPGIENIEDSLMEDKCLGFCYISFSELMLKDVSN